MATKKISRQALVTSLAYEWVEAHPSWTLGGSESIDGLAMYHAFLPIDASCVLFITFSASDGHISIDVGWSPESAPPVGPMEPSDGTLRRIKRLDSPRDFQYAKHSRQLGSLAMGGFAKTYATSTESVGEIAMDIEAFGLPYLDLMLAYRKRPGLLSCMPEYTPSDT